MTVVKVEKNNYTVEPLYQWDLNQVLEIHGLSMAVTPEVHFTSDAMVRAVRRFATMDAAGVIRAEVPNALLQKPYKIKAIICIREGDVFKSYREIAIPVKARNQPADYTITDDGDLYSFMELENLVYDSVARVEGSNAEAMNKANQAVTTANAAATTANGIAATAGAAKTTADAAKTTAETAKTTAEAAKTTADGIAATAAAAKTTAEAAQSTANAATQTANAAAQTANAALPKAGGAVFGALTLTGPLILTEGVHYGTEAQRPAPGVKGRIYFQVVETNG